MKLIILGSGTSTGVPEVGCGCPLCHSEDSRDRRMRSSALLVTDEGKHILIDCGPDWRRQAIRWGIDRVDAILFTHEHSDHTYGLDDIRTLAWRKELPLYAEGRVLETIRTKWHYFFGEHPYPGSPKLKLEEVKADSPFELFGVEIRPIRVMHGSLPILGYQFGEEITYITDMKYLEGEAFQALDSPLLVINALRESKEHPSHQSIKDVLSLLEEHPSEHRQQVLLTHLSHHAPSMRALEYLLPSGLKAAYDGMQWQVALGKVSQLEDAKARIPFEYLNLGRVGYEEALGLQRKLFDEMIEAKKSGKQPLGKLLLCEHEPVLTIGMHGKKENLITSKELLQTMGITLYEIERGGDITYHGPGQLTAYPIIDLEQFGLGIKDYIDLLEESIIELLRFYKIEGMRKPKASGVWLDVDGERERKICAIGVKASRYVTMHGFALNINNATEGFSLINPCGFVGGQVTSIALELGHKVDYTVVVNILGDILWHKFLSRLH